MFDSLGWIIVFGLHTFVVGVVLILLVQKLTASEDETEELKDEEKKKESCNLE